MKITKTSDFEFSIVFDETEIQSLEHIEDLFAVKPETVIRKSIAESLRKGCEGAERFLDDVTGD
jgi:hypothetical protein